MGLCLRHRQVIAAKACKNSSPKCGAHFLEYRVFGQSANVGSLNRSDRAGWRAGVAAVFILTIPLVSGLDRV
jgi:hypothetical protein